MTSISAEPHLISLAPQFLVDDLPRSIAFGRRDGLELHLKEAPKNASERAHRRANEHLDAYAGVTGIGRFYQGCVANGAAILKPLSSRPWGTQDFYIEDPDGYILGFGSDNPT
jgi:catechol 2,3-dioxygenase-like lactoylglutathione lyase family enzyme